MTNDINPARVLLLNTLSIAVPLWIEEFKKLPWEEVSRLTMGCAQIVAEKGDILMFGSKTPGATAEAFNAMAKGIAVLSFVPGGITFFDTHWESPHPDLVSESQGSAPE